MWQALTGQYPVPHTAEEKLADATSARKNAEAEMLTPRALKEHVARKRGEPTEMDKWILRLGGMAAVPGSMTAGAGLVEVALVEVRLVARWVDLQVWNATRHMSI